MSARNLLKAEVALERVELPTHGLGNRCSIHLSYRALISDCRLRISELQIRSVNHKPAQRKA